MEKAEKCRIFVRQKNGKNMEKLNYFIVGVYDWKNRPIGTDSSGTIEELYDEVTGKLFKTIITRTKNGKTTTEEYNGSGKIISRKEEI